MVAMCASVVVCNRSANSCGITAISVCFLPAETREDIAWALKEFQKLKIYPKVVIIDGDNAIKNAVEDTWPSVPTMLCTWHVNKCVLSNCKATVGNDDWPAFDLAWRNVIQSRTIDEFDDR